MILSLIYIIRKIAQKKLDYKFGLVWCLVDVLMAIFAIWPTLLAKTAHLIGIYDPVNMLMFLGIILVIMVLFSLSMEVSKQSEQIKKLTQELAISRKDEYDKKPPDNDEATKESDKED